MAAEVSSVVASEKPLTTVLGDVLSSLDDMTAEDNQTDGDIQRNIYRVARAVVDGEVAAEDAAERLRQCGERVQSLPSLLGDAFTILDIETLMNGESSDERGKFLELASACLSSLQGALQEGWLKERLEAETLESLCLIQSAKTFNQRYVKTKTKLYYKQQKFNLLREESEGYAKLITELGQNVQQLPAVMVLNNVKSLIGRFNLDPNRVLDMILEAFECQSQEAEFFLALLKDYNFDGITVCQMVGFKFKFYQDSVSPPPTSLLHMAALLLQSDFISLQQLYSHLSPTDSKIEEQEGKAMKEAQEKARKMGTVLLSEKASESQEGQEPMETDDVETDVPNQKFLLCEALLRVGDWTHAKAIIDRLPPFVVTSYPPVSKALSNLLHMTLELFYRQFAPLAARGRVYPALSNSASHGVPQLTLFSELPLHVLPMLHRLGPYIAVDPLLFAKVVRVGSGFFKEYNSTERKPQEHYAVWSGIVEIIDQVLLPALSLLQCNCGLAEELWSLLSLLPYQVRYRLYGQWKNETYALHPQLILSKAVTLERARYIMKRLSKENVKPSGRQLGKQSHNNPTVLFDYLLSQIQRYDNFIGPVVDSLKYLTPLAYDVLSFCLIEALASPDKERMKHEDTNISMWLQGLATFCGAIFRKYPIELAGLLQYVANQLKAGKSFDLLVLKEVVQRMAGIEISEEVTDQQLEALSGGELLKAEAGYFAQVRNTKKSSQRLRETLVDDNLGVPLCLLMGQQRNSIIFREGYEKHVKLVGKLYDQCQDTLVQFGNFLATHLTADEYQRRMPNLQALCENYHLQPDIAFFLTRPMLPQSINVKFDELKKAGGSEKVTKTKDAVNKFYVQSVESVTQTLLVSVRALHPPRVWDDISPQLYVTFWTLSLYDVQVPVTRYEAEVAKLKQIADEADASIELTSSKKKKERERCEMIIKRLQDELTVQQENHSRVIARLQHEKDSWFNNRSQKNRMITQLLQLCIFPRCCFTALDAVYCGEFVHTLHMLKTPNFSTLLFCDRVFSDIARTVTCCTENEASRYGRFLCCTLKMVMRWHDSKDLYRQECNKYPGFVSMIRADPSKDASSGLYLEYENYRHICFKWHFRLTKSLVACLESKDYTQIRNSLLVLTKILHYYPVVQNLGEALEKRIETIREQEKEQRPDLYALAIGYAGLMKNRQEKYVAESEFHLKAEKDVTLNQRTGSSMDGKTTSQESEGQVKVNGGSSALQAAEKPKATSKPVEKLEKLEKPSVAVRRSPAPVKSSAANSPALSGEPEKKPAVKRENASSEGDKRGGSRAAVTLTSDAGKNEGSSRSPSLHGKSPLPSKDEKTDSTDKQRTSEGGREASKDVKTSQSTREPRETREMRSSGKRDRDDGKSQERDKSSVRQPPSPATTSSSTSRKSRASDIASQENEEDEREVKRRKTGKEGASQVESSDSRNRDRLDKSHDSRDSSRDSGREKGEKERERERERDRERDKEKVVASKASERKRDREKDANGDPKESKRHRTESDTAAAVAAEPASKTSSETDGKTKHRGKMIQLNRTTVTTSPDRRKLRDPGRDQKEPSRDLKLRDVRESRGVVSTATRSTRERGEKYHSSSHQREKH